MSSILWVSWKDIKNPEKGGAEIVTHEIRKRLAAEGHTVTHLTSGFDNGEKEEVIDGVKTVRNGKSKLTLFLALAIHYLKHEKNKHDVIIEEVNTTPFFLNLLKGKEKLFLFFHQLAGKVWDYESPFPLNIIGRYILEPTALFLERIKDTPVLAMSESTKRDLVKYGFNEQSISVLPEATDSPIGLTPQVEKSSNFIVMYFGNFRKMKRPEEVIKAFALAYEKNNTIGLVLSGNGNRKRIDYLKNLISDLGITIPVVWSPSPSDEMKYHLMRRTHVLCMTSIKEGWGTVITEAGKLGTPSIVYDVDGLRDAVSFGKSGIIVPDNDTKALADAILSLATNSEKYEALSKAAFEFNKELTFDKTYDAFKKAVGLE